jgi:hypothetical protein
VISRYWSSCSGVQSSSEVQNLYQMHNMTRVAQLGAREISFSGSCRPVVLFRALQAGHVKILSSVELPLVALTKVRLEAVLFLMDGSVEVSNRSME